MSTITHEHTETQKKIDAEVLERVKRGIAWLEEQHGPDWVDRIDLDTLDLLRGNCCVLGQIYAEKESLCKNGYDYATDRWFYSDGHPPPEDYGFYATSSQGWAELNEAWHQVLTPMVERAA